MTSMPYQVVLMRIRRIYRWEDPTETAIWLTGYLLCWAFNQLTGAAVRQGFSLSLTGARRSLRLSFTEE